MDRSVDDLVREYRPIAWSVARKYLRRSGAYKDREDIEQDAMIGLWKAVMTHNPERSSFALYASVKCWQAIVDGYRERNRSRRRGSIETAPLDLTLEGRWGDNEVSYCDQRSFQLWKEEETYAESIPDRGDVARVMSQCLTEQESFVLGLSLWDDVPQAEIADLLGVSASRVSQIKSHAIAKVGRRMGLLQDA